MRLDIKMTVEFGWFGKGEIDEFQELSRLTTAYGDKVRPSDLWYSGYTLDVSQIPEELGQIWLTLVFLNLRSERVDRRHVWDHCRIGFDKFKGRKVRVTNVDLKLTPSNEEFQEMFLPISPRERET